MHDTTEPLTHIRTPTYRRPAELKRCLESLLAQSRGNWVCDVYDDDPAGSGLSVVQDIGDPRIRHNQNDPQLFASKNIDQCFTSRNPRGADYFCVVEDDNYILPGFIEDNIRICHEHRVEIVFRNQLIEFASGTADARLSDFGILDRKLNEGRYDPDMFRLSLVADIGVSNGGLFWSRNAATDMEIGHECSATLQEYLRTYAISDAIFVAMEPLAVWAENGDATTRDLGAGAGYYRSELNLKRSIRILQRKAWARAKQDETAGFLENPVFAYAQAVRARGLVKSHIMLNVGRALPLSEKVWLAYRGTLIRLLGRPEPGLRFFLNARG